MSFTTLLHWVLNKDPLKSVVHEELSITPAT